MVDRFSPVPRRLPTVLLASLVAVLSAQALPAAKRSDQSPDMPSRAVDVSQSTRDLVQADCADAAFCHSGSVSCCNWRSGIAEQRRQNR